MKPFNLLKFISNKESGYKGSVFYIIDKHTGDVVNNEMGRGCSASGNDWDKIEEYALQLSDKLRQKPVAFVPDWTIVAFPCDDIRTAYQVQDNYDKVVNIIRSRKPSATIDLRAAYYASENSLEFDHSKTEYNWMNDAWNIWLKQQQQLEKAELHKANGIFLSSMFVDQNIPTDKDIEKIRRIFLENKDDNELLKSILNQILNSASKNRRVMLFGQIESILSETDLYEENQFSNLNDFFDMAPDKMEPIHILSAELLEKSLENRKENEVQKRKDLYRVRRFLYRYHKAKGQLTDNEHVFEMEEEVDTVLSKWRERLSKEEVEHEVKSVNTHPNPEIIKPIKIDMPENFHKEEPIESEEEVILKEANKENDNPLDINKSITESINLLEKGHPLREQILQYLKVPSITKAQLEWAASQMFITPMSLVEDGTLVSGIIETDFFNNEIGKDLQHINPEKMDKVLQLVCLSYDIFCRRELYNTAALLDELKKHYTMTMIKEDTELTNRYTYLYLICDVRKRCYEAVSKKVCELKKIEYEKKRENDLAGIEKMINILMQENIAPTLQKTAWESMVSFLTTWKDDGISLQALILAITDKAQTHSIDRLITRLLCHSLNVQEFKEALTIINSKGYNKNCITLNDYFTISLYHLQAIVHQKWLERECVKRREWGSVFDKLQKKKPAWVNEYIAEPETLLQHDKEELIYKENAKEWAESIILYRFCGIDDIPYGELAENVSFQTDIQPAGTSLQDPVRNKNIWATLPPEEEIKIEQALQSIAACVPVIETEDEDNAILEDEEEYIKNPDGKGYILNGVRVFSKTDCRIISQAFSFVIWRQTKNEEQIESYKHKLIKLKDKMEAEGIQWPATFMKIYNGIINK